MKDLRQISALVQVLFQERWRPLPCTRPAAKEWPELCHPGVYILACSKSNLRGRLIEPHRIIYVGVSHSKKGVLGRVGDFIYGLEMKRPHDAKRGAHSAARHYRRLHCGGGPFSQKSDGKAWYFAAATIPSSPKDLSTVPSKLRVHGAVLCLEQYTLAHVQEVRPYKAPVLNTPNKQLHSE